MRKNIVKAKETDLPIIVGLNRQFHLDLPNFRWDRPWWISQEIKKGNFFVLKDKELVVGAICLVPTKNELTIETVAIKKDFQGLGLGKALVEFAKNQAKKQAKSRLTVESFRAYNLEEFYQKCGFKLDNPRIDYFKGRPFLRFFMSV